MYIYIYKKLYSLIFPALLFYDISTFHVSKHYVGPDYKEGQRGQTASEDPGAKLKKRTIFEAILMRILVL